MKPVLCVLVSLLIVAVAGAPLFHSSLIDQEHGDRLSRVLEDRLRVIRDTNSTRLAVCQALAAGQTTLLEAAAVFQFLDARLPPSVIANVPEYPGSSEAERICRRVIDYIDAAYPRRLDAAPRVRAARARLTAELEALLASAETIVLPRIVLPLSY